MSHQDWEPVVIHGKNTSSHVHKSTALQNASGTKHLKEIAESNDIGKLKELSSQDRQTMISMRAAKGLKQDQLAQCQQVYIKILRVVKQYQHNNNCLRLIFM